VGDFVGKSVVGAIVDLVGVTEGLHVAVVLVGPIVGVFVRADGEFVGVYVYIVGCTLGLPVIVIVGFAVVVIVGLLEGCIVVSGVVGPTVTIVGFKVGV
jgi:hypothetical protein